MKSKKKIKRPRGHGPLCDWRNEKEAVGAKSKKPAPGPGTRLMRHTGAFRWRGVGVERYKEPAGHWGKVKRMVLSGAKGEGAGFHVRYFELAPGGHTSLERHRHEHVVIAVRGSGVAVTGGRKRELRFMDTLYIAPGEVHALHNPSLEPFGFFCIVDAERDRPEIMEE